MPLWIKGCPRCGGDLYSDRDVMGYYRQCMQCGFTLYEERRRPPVPASADDVRQPTQPDSSDRAKERLSEAA